MLADAHRYQVKNYVQVAWWLGADLIFFFSDSWRACLLLVCGGIQKGFERGWDMKW
jgi:hypothetical protein